MEEVVGGEVAEVFGFAGADVPVEGVEAEAEMRAADVGDEGGGGLEVVAKGAVGLEFQRGSEAALACLLGDLNQRNLHVARLSVDRAVRNIAGDDDRADVQLAAEIEPAAEEIPGFAAGFALAREEAALKTGDGKCSRVFSSQ